MAKSKQSAASRNPGAGLQSGLASKDPIGNVEGQLSKTLNPQTAKQGPRSGRVGGHKTK